MLHFITGALTAKLGTLSVEAQSKLEKDTAKKEAKAEAKADAALKKKMASQVCAFGYRDTTIFTHLILSVGDDQADREE